MQTVSLIEGVAKKSALDISNALRRRLIRSIDLVEWLITKAQEQTTPVFLTITAERALREAELADKRLDEGNVLSQFDGMPIGWKDLFDMQGEITTAGSILYRNRPKAKKDADIVSIAKKAGMISLGKLNLTELAFTGIGDNPHFGTPFSLLGQHVSMSPGGSSSGSAVAVADHYLPIAIGTDTGGSVRLPAAFNGVVGFKTSINRYPRNGMTFLSRSLDTIGLLTKTVADCISIDHIFSGQHFDEINSNEFKPSFFVPQNIVLDDLDKEVESDFIKVIDIIKDNGFDIKEIEIPAFEFAFKVMKEFGSIVSYEAWNEHKDVMVADYAKKLHPYSRQLIEKGQKITLSDLDHITQMQFQGKKQIFEQLGNGFMLYPTTPILPPDISKILYDQKKYHKINVKSLRNTTLSNQFDLPSLALPIRNDELKKTSLQISACSGRDMQVLNIAKKIEHLINAHLTLDFE